MMLSWSLATLKRVTVTPAVSPRLFEFFTTLTLEALRKNHIVATACETIAKKNTETK